MLVPVVSVKSNISGTAYLYLKKIMLKMVVSNFRKLKERA